MRVSVHPITHLDVSIAPGETLHRKRGLAPGLGAGDHPRYDLASWASSMWNGLIGPEEVRLLTANQSGQLD